MHASFMKNMEDGLEDGGIDLRGSVITFTIVWFAPRFVHDSLVV